MKLNRQDVLNKLEEHQQESIKRLKGIIEFYIKKTEMGETPTRKQLNGQPYTLTKKDIERAYTTISDMSLPMSNEYIDRVSLRVGVWG